MSESDNDSEDESEEDVTIEQTHRMHGNHSDEAMPAYHEHENQIN